MSLSTLIFFIIGIGLLPLGADLLVRGASRIATRFGISPLVVGLTVVAFGTSAPELAVSVQSAFAGSTSLALGNVVGSNILNVLLILGLSAVVAPLVVHRQLVRIDVPLVIVASLATWALASDGHIGRLDGILLFASAVAYVGFSIHLSRRNGGGNNAETAPETEGPPGLGENLALLAGGLVLLVFGARWLVAGAVEIAHLLGLSDLVIGLTVVAVGTSLPELATSVVAGMRGERDIAVGNVVGSNLFNLLVVLGLTSIVAPHGVEVSPAAFSFDIPVMTAVAVACLPIFARGHLIGRWEGWLFLGYYIAYTTFLVLDATGHHALPLFRSAMLHFVLPLTAVTLVVLSWRILRRPRE